MLEMTVLSFLLQLFLSESEAVELTVVKAFTEGGRFGGTKVYKSVNTLTSRPKGGPFTSFSH